MSPHHERHSAADERRAAERVEETKRHLDERLDEALEETFPASDPIAVSPPGSHGVAAPSFRPARD